MDSPQELDNKFMLCWHTTPGMASWIRSHSPFFSTKYSCSLFNSSENLIFAEIPKDIKSVLAKLVNTKFAILLISKNINLSWYYIRCSVIQVEGSPYKPFSLSDDNLNYLKKLIMLK